ncbi:MAG: transposase [Aquimonas sp.]|nr:transposase [Aquimonas sp.]
MVSIAVHRWIPACAGMTKSASPVYWKINELKHQAKVLITINISRKLVEKAKDTGRGIKLEQLKYIRKRTTVRKSDRAQHSGWSFFQLQSFIEYKAKREGVAVQYVDPCNTSRQCAACGHTEKANRKTQSRFQCVACGHVANADQNASINIAARAHVNKPIVACNDDNGLSEHSRKPRRLRRGN